MLRPSLLARTLAALSLAVAAVTACRPKPAASGPGRALSRVDWTRFGWDAARSSAPAPDMAITAANVTTMRRQQVHLDGTVDGSAIYLHAVTVKGAIHNVFFVTTTYGRTIAVDADDGRVLWTFTPPGEPYLEGTHIITTATPVADPDREHLYAAAADGMVRRLAVADGKAEWAAAVTVLPAFEKVASALNYWHGRVIVTTGGYIGDRPPYQGHVALLDAATGRLDIAWNALCSHHFGVLDPTKCPESGAAIWGRAGAVVDTTTGDLYVATGNATWDGQKYWGDATVELDSMAAGILGNYTPANTAQLDARDLDLGSTSPVLLGGGLVAQGGKDGFIRLLDWSAMKGDVPHKGGEAQIVPTPGSTDLFTAPAVWHHAGATWLFAADNAGTAAWTVSGGRLVPAWQNPNRGTSPVVADGLLFVYDPDGGLRVYDAPTGKAIANLECGLGHWNSPIVVDGRIALPEGNANKHETRGVLDIWRLP